MIGTWRRVLFALTVSALLVVPATAAQAAPSPDGVSEWWFDSWTVPTLWSEGANGSGITIAEIDTGVNTAWPALAGNVLPGKDYGVAADIGHVDHDVKQVSGVYEGHGTQMASIMVAQQNSIGVLGLAPGAKILPIALPLKNTDDEDDSGSDHLADAIRWAADNGANIISMSLGESRDQVADQDVPCPTDEQAAITYAISKGLIVVAASGNDAPSTAVTDPGVCLGVVSVGAVDSSNTVASFSQAHPYLTMTAPGVKIPALAREVDTAVVGWGTSQATAITSASLALIWSKFPMMTGRQILSKALSTLDHASVTRDPSYGYGIINPARAIASGNENAANSVYDSVAPFVSRLQAAQAASESSPVPPASTNTTVPGNVVVGAAPTAWSSSVQTSLAVFVCALLALCALAVVGRRARRRRLHATTPLPEFGFHVRTGASYVWPETDHSTPAPPQPHPLPSPPLQAHPAAVPPADVGHTGAASPSHWLNVTEAAADGSSDDPRPEGRFRRH